MYSYLKIFMREALLICWGSLFWLYLIALEIVTEEQDTFPVGQHKEANHRHQRRRKIHLLGTAYCPHRPDYFKSHSSSCYRECQSLLIMDYFLP